MDHSSPGVSEEQVVSPLSEVDNRPVLSRDLAGWRFSGDRVRMDELLADEDIRRGLESGKLLQERSTQRSLLLGNAVMVEPSVLPQLASAIGGVVKQFPEVGEVECFVYSAAEVNAFVTAGRTRTLIGVSSAAVNNFSDAELGFVIGHEVGHALFQHNSFSAGHLVAQGDLSPTVTMRVRAWQRAAEISADRAGLAACGTIEAAARALFKSTSGIVSDAVQVSPARFAQQWQRLLDEVVDEGQRDFWQSSHPFPPLRMKALMLFWETLDQPDAYSLRDADASIEKMLAMMDPAAAEQALQDPMLGAFFFWGGLYAAFSGGTIDEAERRRLASVAPATVNLVDAIQRAKESPASCLEAFVECHRSRRKKLSAAELHRIVFGLIDVVSADGPVNAGERSRLKELVGVVGIQADACDLLISQYEQEAHREG